MNENITAELVNDQGEFGRTPEPVDTREVVNALKAAAELLKLAAETLEADDSKVPEITRSIRGAIRQLSAKIPNPEQVQGSMECLRALTQEPASLAVKDLNAAISKELMILGIPPHLSGFSYLVWCVNFVTGCTDSSWRMNAVYDSILSSMHLEPTSKNKTRAERCMRHAISVAFDKPCNNYRDHCFCGQTSADDGTPSVSAFISVVAERIKLKRGMVK